MAEVSASTMFWTSDPLTASSSTGMSRSSRSGGQADQHVGAPTDEHPRRRVAMVSTMATWIDLGRTLRQH